MLGKRILPRCIVCAVLTVSLAAQSVHRDITIEDDREPAPRFHAKTLDGEQFTNDSTKGQGSSLSGSVLISTDEYPSKQASGFFYGHKPEPLVSAKSLPRHGIKGIVNCDSEI